MVILLKYHALILTGKKQLKQFVEDNEFPCVGARDWFHVCTITKCKSYIAVLKNVIRYRKWVL